MNDELIKDMQSLARLVLEMSKKHGEIYISATCCQNSDIGLTMYGANKNFKTIDNEGWSMHDG